MNVYPLLAHCSFDKAPTGGSIAFEVVAVVASVAALFLLRNHVKILWPRAAVMALGVLIFEVFTGPMWLNQHLGVWAYIYTDVSWILTLGWTAMILTVVVFVDRWKADWTVARRFPLYLGLLTPIVLIAEVALVNLGIRSYAPETIEATTGIVLIGVPIEFFYYTPVFASLVIAFYKYWECVIDHRPLIPTRKRRWLRGIGLAFAAVFLFELMIEPIAENRGFPTWSYIYRDISFLMSGLWVLVIAIGALVVDKFFLDRSILVRFLIAIGVMGMIMLCFESWLILNGFRVYGHSAVSNFSGFKSPITGLAAEVSFAIPFYLALIVGFIRFWEIALDNRIK